MIKSIAFLIVLLPTIVLADSNKPVMIKTGFVAANDYRGFALQRKRAYAVGLIDGMLVAPLFSAPKSKLRWLENCLIGMTDYQIVAILDKYLRDNPARWHESMNTLAWNAIWGGCKKRGKLKK